MLNQTLVGFVWFGWNFLEIDAGRFSTEWRILGRVECVNGLVNHILNISIPRAFNWTVFPFDINLFSNQLLGYALF